MRDAAAAGCRSSHDLDTLFWGNGHGAHISLPGLKLIFSVQRIIDAYKAHDSVSQSGLG